MWKRQRSKTSKINNSQISIFLIFSLIFSVFVLFTQPSSAIETEKCKDCHGIGRITEITKDCLVCHDTHGAAIQPEDRNPDKVHIIHDQFIGIRGRQEACQKCHRSPADCEKCHNSHENVDNFVKKRIELRKAIGNTTRGNTTRTAKNISVPQCVDCHNKLPQPLGHTDFRNSLSNSKHKWMNCKTCHLNPEKGTGETGELDEFKLRFKIFTVGIDESIKICKICHSLQYEELQEGTHGDIKKKCVNCHDPHSTSATGPKFATPKETPVNFSTRLDGGIKWVTNKVPILKNTSAMFIIFIVILVVIAEYILSKHEEGQKVAYDMIKIYGGEDSLKTLEVKLREKKDINIISNVLEENDINILGMTMKKEKDDLYKCVIFVDNLKIDEAGLIDKLSSVADIKSVEFSDKYEL